MGYGPLEPRVDAFLGSMGSVTSTIVSASRLSVTELRVCLQPLPTRFYRDNHRPAPLSLLCHSLWSNDYKQALVDYGAKDIVRTSNLSGTPLTVVNTPYVQKVGTKASGLQKFLMKNKRLKKYVKMFVTYRGMKSIEKSAFGASYKTFYVAGPTIENIHEIKPLKLIVKTMIEEYEAAEVSS